MQKKMISVGNING